MSPDFRQPFPRVVRIEPASQCNLSCSHCPTGTVEMPRGVMSQEIFDRVLTELHRHADAVKVVVMYHGGEPLLNKRLFAMIDSVKESGDVFVRMVSNGTALTDSVIKKIVASPLDFLVISLDGQSESQNNFIRRGSKADKVIANIKRLIDHKRHLGRSTPAIQIATTQFIDPTKPTTHQKAQPPHYLQKALGENYSLGLTDYDCTFAMRWPHMNVDERLYDIYFDPDDPGEKNYCDHVINTITIRANGDIVPCCYDLTSRSVMGNIAETELMKIWNGRRYLELRRSIHHRDFNPLCDNCNTVKSNVYVILKPDLLQSTKAA